MSLPVNTILQAPFPYFGGKSAVAEMVWNALGDVAHYIEPFFGSGAVLLARPNYDSAKHTESVCDKDGFIANVWRSIQYSPEETAKWCDWPVNHADLMARRKTLIKNEEMLLENLVNDDIWHDPKLAGYWIWAASCWIGSGLTRPGAMPRIGDSGVGVHRISLTGARPHIGRTGDGVHKISLTGKIPHIIDAGKAINSKHKRNRIYEWFEKLSNRLRSVRVVCGDWTRVCGGNWQTNIGICGMFFDPPYGTRANRDSGIYHQDSLSVADEVREWAIKRANNPQYRIVIAGYYEEHKELLDLGWRCLKWTAGGGYSNQAKEKNDNRFNETLFFSPYCIDNGIEQLELLEMKGGAT